MKEDVSNLISALKKFSPSIIDLGEKIIDNRISDFEEKLGINLPEDYKFLLSNLNGFSLMGTEVYGVYSQSEKPLSLETVYKIEHFEVQMPQPSYLVPFSPDGRGNFYCFDTRTVEYDSCPIVFWVSNYEYQGDDVPEITNGSFVDWVSEVVLDWTLEDYDYDGSPREET
jgi:hypothetical protein